MAQAVGCPSFPLDSALALSNRLLEDRRSTDHRQVDRSRRQVKRQLGTRLRPTRCRASSISKPEAPPPSIAPTNSKLCVGSGWPWVTLLS